MYCEKKTLNVDVDGKIFYEREKGERSFLGNSLSSGNNLKDVGEY